MMAMVMLSGVAVFSFVMGNFIEILDKTKKLDEDLEQADDLGKFLGLLHRFNNNQPLSVEFKEGLEDFFQFRWSVNRDWCIETEDDRALLEQLPVD